MTEQHEGQASKHQDSNQQEDEQAVEKVDDAIAACPVFLCLLRTGQQQHAPQNRQGAPDKQAIKRETDLACGRHHARHQPEKLRAEQVSEGQQIENPRRAMHQQHHPPAEQ